MSLGGLFLLALTLLGWVLSVCFFRISAIRRMLMRPMVFITQAFVRMWLAPTFFLFPAANGFVRFHPGATIDFYAFVPIQRWPIGLLSSVVLLTGALIFFFVALSLGQATHLLMSLLRIRIDMVSFERAGGTLYKLPPLHSFFIRFVFPFFTCSSVCFEMVCRSP